MGCCGSSAVSAGHRERLDEVQRKVAACPKDGETGLEDMERCAKELKEVMDDVYIKGSKDRETMSRVEVLSDHILNNLTARITVDLLRKGAIEYQPLVDRIMRIAKVLDSVRATKATGAVESHVELERTRIDSELERRAAVKMGQIVDWRKKMLANPAAQMVVGFKSILDLVEEASKVAPGHQKVAHQLLTDVSNLSIWILEPRQVEVWGPSEEACKAIKTLAARLDMLAGELVKVKSAVWDPAMEPIVDQAIKDMAEKTIASVVKECHEELKIKRPGGAYDSLEKLVPWWPYLKDEERHSLDIVAVFTKVHSYANDVFVKATAASEKETVDQIRSFAEKFDALRAQFEGLPPSGDTGLGESLEKGEAKGFIIKQVNIISKELAKETDSDAKTHLNMAITLQALEQIVSRWEAMSSDAECATQVEATCKSIEAWVEKATASCLNYPDRMSGLLKFAEEYDSRRIQLAPKDEPLAPRIAVKVAEAHVKVAESLLGDTKKPIEKPQRLIDAMKKAGSALPESERSSECRDRLGVIFGDVDTRILTAFTKSITEETESNARKEDLLMKVATQIDEMRVAFKISNIWDDSVSQSLVSRMSGKRAALVGEHLNAMERGLGSEGRENFAAVAASLAKLAQAWNDSVGAELRDRYWKLETELQDRLRAACKRATSDGENSAEALLELATTMEVDGNLIRSKSGEKEDLSLSDIFRRRAAELHLEQAKAAAEALDMDRLTKELLCLRDLSYKKGGLTDAVAAPLQEFIRSLEDPLMRAFGKTDRPEAVIKAAATAEDLYNLVSRGKDGEGVQLQKRIEGVQKFSAKLREANDELSKPTGMNPRLVMQVLKSLDPMWAPVAHLEACKAQLLSTLEQFRHKLEEATLRALSDEKKLQGLMDFASEADQAQKALAEKGKDMEVESFQEAMYRAVASERLKTMEAELEKETGRNPQILLKGTEELAKIWGNMGGESPMSPGATATLELRKRWEAARKKVHDRTLEAMDEANGASNETRRQGLLKFAESFDAASAKLGESGGGLKEELEARGSMPTGSLPKDSVPTGTMPKESLPKESLPKGSVPKESLPKESLPKGSVPKDSLPKDSLPKGSMPKDSVPTGTMPKDSLPKESLPKDSAPTRTMPKDSLPKGSMPKGSVPKGSSPKGES